MSYKIKKNGWLWKLHKQFNSEVYLKLRYNQPVGLCLFFWNTLFQMLKAVGSVVGISVVVCASVAILLAGFALVLNFVVGLISAACGILLPFIDYDLAAIITFGLLLVGSICIVVESFLHLIGSNSTSMKVAPKWLTKPVSKVVASLPAKKEEVVKEPSLVVSYWKAFKGKVCPLVEVVE